MSYWVEVGVKTCSLPKTVRPQHSEMKHLNNKCDLISKLICKNVPHVLENIFLALGIEDLRSSRLVCKAWLEYIKKEFWNSALRASEYRLEQNWRTEKHKRVELRIREIPCRANCLLNSRECDCPTVWLCDSQNLIVLLNGRVLRASNNINDQTQFTQTKLFERPQYQVKFTLKKDLELDSSNFLSRPVFFRKKSPRKKIRIGDNFMEITDSVYVRVLDENSTELFRFLPYTGKSSGV